MAKLVKNSVWITKHYTDKSNAFLAKKSTALMMQPYFVVTSKHQIE